ncbi:hypothetical protein [Rhizobium chutanense]|uniref:hypothetical protein n=1 Tax=Rhizobium chutanense TaxID=2035448 RepID=UPI0018EF825A
MISKSMMSVSSIGVASGSGSPAFGPVCPDTRHFLSHSAHIFGNQGPPATSDATKQFPLRLWIKRNGGNNQQTWRMKGIRPDIAEYHCPETAPCAAETKGFADVMMLDYRGQSPNRPGQHLLRQGRRHTHAEPVSLHAVDDLRKP